MASDDDDKTVFGQAIPQAPRPGQAPPPRGAPAPPPRQAAPPPRPGGPPPDMNPNSPDHTVFGTPIAPQGGAGGRSAPGQPAQPHRGPVQQPPIQAPPHQSWGDGDDTWLGGNLNPTPGGPGQGAQGYGGFGPGAGQPYAPPPAAAPQPPRPSPMPASPQPARVAPVSGAPQPRPMGNHGANHHSGALYDTDTGRRGAGELFPEVRQQQVNTGPALRQKIALQDALRATGLGAGGPNNPLVAAAANLLILMGRLRTGMVEMQSAPLLEHVARELDTFENNALEAGQPPEDVQDAKYALAATADDIVQNLPGADRGMWLEYSMGARFFGERNAGVGFFQRMDKAMKAPGQKFHLLDLMLTCLSLGFEGQYRAMANGPNELARIRKAIYETLRKVVPRPDDDVSPRWLPVIFTGKRRRGGVPVWVAAAIAGTAVVGLFAALATLISSESGETQQGIAMLHLDLPAVAIERTAPVVRQPEPPRTSQLDRVKEALAGQEIEVELKNEWILFRLGSVLRFDSGKATLTNDLTELAREIGKVLNEEPGPIRVVGHTDAVGAEGSNLKLSQARAATVATLLSETVTSPDRILTEGKGEAIPIASNDTQEGRARNRRVEIMIRREGSTDDGEE